MQESIWALSFAVVALLVTWAWCDFDWPSTPAWTFYAPYSLYTFCPWTSAAGIFVVLVGVRTFVVMRRSRVARSGEQAS